MTLAVDDTARSGSHFRRGGAVASPRTRMRPLRSSLAALTAVLVGAWAAVCVYVGPYFDFRPTSHGAWAWTYQNGLLHLLPGAVAVAAGLMLLAVSGRSSLLPGALLLAAGAWLVVGPAAWPLIHGGRAFTAAAPGRSLLYQACASLAPGLILAFVAGSAVKAAVARTAVEEFVEPADIDTVGVDATGTGRIHRVGTAGDAIGEVPGDGARTVDSGVAERSL